MEYRTLELTLVSAKGLKKANLLRKMDVYAVASVYDTAGRDQKLKTPVDKEGDCNPTWNFPMKFTIDEYAARQNRLTLVVKIKAVGTFGDKEVGEVHVPMKDLLDGVSKETQFVSYQVRKPSGKPKGEVSFSYKFGEKVSGKASKAEEPVTAYPAGASSGYPPPYAAAAGGVPGAYPPTGGGYNYPAPAGYPPQSQAGHAYQHQQQPGNASYPPPPPGYGGYPPRQGYGYPPVQQPQKKNKFGMGLGAGLLGGALGGLLIGDIASDAAYGDGGGCGGGGGGCGGGCGGF